MPLRTKQQHTRRQLRTPIESAGIQKNCLLDLHFCVHPGHSVTTPCPMSPAELFQLPRANWVPWGFAGLAILAQIGWPLTSGTARLRMTFVCVILYALASMSHALVFRGARWAAGFAAITIAVSFTAECLGVHTGVPFTNYLYSPTLGIRLFGVPLLVLLAWLMAAYPALIIARRLASNRIKVALLGGFALAAWDVFLDPQMVGEGYWTWRTTSPSLPGVTTVPLVNYFGWFVVATILIALLDLLPTWPQPADARSEAVPALLWTWTWIGGVVGNLFFFGRPWVALWGGLAMGAITIPYLLSLRRTTTSARTTPVIEAAA